jgi:hypothetical protein
MNGHQWYSLQGDGGVGVCARVRVCSNAIAAFRALNQAMGRGIRHINDWCAMLLVDARHCRGATTPRLSSWLRPRIEDYDEHYADMCDELEKFFASHAVKAVE